MSSQQPHITPTTVKSETTFDHDRGTATGATAIHTATVDDTTYRLRRVFARTESGHIKVKRQGIADGQTLITDTTYHSSVTETATHDQIAGEPQSFVGLVMAIHYERPPTDQLDALVQAHHHASPS